VGSNERRARLRRGRIDDRDLAWIEAGTEPAFQHGAAHLAGTDQNQPAGKPYGAVGGHASPCVSSKAPSSASPAVRPAQMTNWKAGK